VTVSKADDNAVDSAAARAFIDQYGRRATELPPLAIVIAAYNEEGAIGPVVEALPSVISGLEVAKIVVSDGSVLMNVLASGTPHEMVTMFHMDGGDLLATHYCAAHNQPRFRMAAPSDANVVAFEFKDATNLSSPDAPHMVGVKFTLLDADHHLEDWTFLANGQANTRRFDFHRKS